jgi:hypothetical protein
MAGRHVTKIDRAAYVFLQQNPDASPLDLVTKLGMKRRTASRYVKSWNELGADNITPFNSSARVQAASITNLPDRDDWEALLNEDTDYTLPITNIDHLTIATDKPVGFMLTSCQHLGSRYSDHEEFQALMNLALETDQMYIVTMGDLIEGYPADFSDKSAPPSQILSLQRQRRLIKRLLADWNDANKLVCGLAGQHDVTWQQRYEGESELKTFFMEDLGVPFYDGTVYLKMAVGTVNYFVALAHKFPGFSMWNPVHALMRALRFRYPMADIIAQGDKHQYAYQEVTAFEDEFKMGNRASRFAHLIQVGTAKTKPDRYTVQAYSGGTFEWPIIVLDPKKHNIKVVKRLSDAKLLMNA